MATQRIIPISAIALLLACSPVTLKSSDGGSGDDGAMANIDADPATPDAGASCNSNGSEDSCIGETLHQCSNAGVFQDISCELGCSTAGQPHCQELISSLLGATLSEGCEGTQTFAPEVPLVFDTGTGEISMKDATVIRQAGIGIDVQTGIGFDVHSQGTAPEIGIFSFNELILPNGDFDVLGPRSVAFLACGRMEIAGVINANSRGIQPGPGGYTPGGADGTGGPGEGGNAVPYQGNDDQGGGGGGGHGGAGGGGGSGINAGGTRGILFGNTSLVPLVGGSAGGSAGSGNLGGGGGGAVYLASGISIRFSGGGINAGGGGGSVAGQFNGAGGGGAGGAIFLDAPTIQLTNGATLAANGGGGGNSNGTPVAGGDGLLSLAAAGSQ